MEEGQKSRNNLKEFVRHFKLQDNHSNIDFEGKVQIKTEHNSLETNARLLISFRDYNSLGKIDVISDDIDATIFPISYETKYQTIEFVDGMYLKIKGEHPNPNIGGYIFKLSV